MPKHDPRQATPKASQLRNPQALNTASCRPVRSCRRHRAAC